MRGYFGVGIENPFYEDNVGTLFRTACIFGAEFLFTVGRHYTRPASDTTKSYKHLPFYNYVDLDDFHKHLPLGCKVIGVELDVRAVDIKNFCHPERSIYILGNESAGLTKCCIDMCDYLIKLPGKISLNVSTAGSIVIFDRINKSSVGDKKFL